MANEKKSSAKNKKRNTIIVVVIVIILVLVLVAVGILGGLGVGIFAIFFNKSDKVEAPVESTTETTTEMPSDITIDSVIVEKPESTDSFYNDVTYRSPDAKTADIYKHGRNLMLLNRQYELPEDFEWDLVYWEDGTPVDAMYLNCEEHNTVKALDKAAYQPLKDMFAAAKADGVPLELVSPYRSIHLQNKIFTRSVNSYMDQGYSETEAINKANYALTFPGTSEHNSGLAFDIVEKGNFALNASAFEKTEQYKWLVENAEDYGFILRYAKDKVDKTGIMYEPWHFRYVGVEHAKKINDLGMCLEEYIEYLEA